MAFSTLISTVLSFWNVSHSELHSDTTTLFCSHFFKLKQSKGKKTMASRRPCLHSVHEGSSKKKGQILLPDAHG